MEWKMWTTHLFSLSFHISRASCCLVYFVFLFFHLWFQPLHSTTLIGLLFQLPFLSFSCLLFRHLFNNLKDAVSKHFQEVGTHIAIYMSSYPRRWRYSSPPLQESEVLFMTLHLLDFKPAINFFCGVCETCFFGVPHILVKKSWLSIIPLAEDC
jgi:hypothetical protein